MLTRNQRKRRGIAEPAGQRPKDDDDAVKGGGFHKAPKRPHSDTAPIIISASVSPKKRKWSSPHVAEIEKQLLEASADGAVGDASDDSSSSSFPSALERSLVAFVRESKRLGVQGRESAFARDVVRVLDACAKTPSPDLRARVLHVLASSPSLSEAVNNVARASSSSLSGFELPRDEDVWLAQERVMERAFKDVLEAEPERRGDKPDRGTSRGLAAARDTSQIPFLRASAPIWLPPLLARLLPLSSSSSETSAADRTANAADDDDPLKFAAFLWEKAFARSVRARRDPSGGDDGSVVDATTMFCVARTIALADGARKPRLRLAGFSPSFTISCALFLYEYLVGDTGNAAGLLWGLACRPPLAGEDASPPVAEEGHDGEWERPEFRARALLRLACECFGEHEANVVFVGLLDRRRGRDAAGATLSPSSPSSLSRIVFEPPGWMNGRAVPLRPVPFFQAMRGAESQLARLSLSEASQELIAALCDLERLGFLDPCVVQQRPQPPATVVFDDPSSHAFALRALFAKFPGLAVCAVAKQWVSTDAVRQFLSLEEFPPSVALVSDGPAAPVLEVVRGLPPSAATATKPTTLRRWFLELLPPEDRRAVFWEVADWARRGMAWHVDVLDGDTDWPLALDAETVAKLCLRLWGPDAVGGVYASSEAWTLSVLRRWASSSPFSLSSPAADQGAEMLTDDVQGALDRAEQEIGKSFESFAGLAIWCGVDPSTGTHQEAAATADDGALRFVKPARESIDPKRVLDGANRFATLWQFAVALRRRTGKSSDDLARSFPILFPVASIVYRAMADVFPQQGVGEPFRRAWQALARCGPWTLADADRPMAFRDQLFDHMWRKRSRALLRERARHLERSTVLALTRADGGDSDHHGSGGRDSPRLLRTVSGFPSGGRPSSSLLQPPRRMGSYPFFTSSLALLRRTTTPPRPTPLPLGIPTTTAAEAFRQELDFVDLPPPPPPRQDHHQQESSNSSSESHDDDGGNASGRQQQPQRVGHEQEEGGAACTCGCCDESSSSSSSESSSSSASPTAARNEPSPPQAAAASAVDDDVQLPSGVMMSASGGTIYVARPMSSYDASSSSAGSGGVADPGVSGSFSTFDWTRAMRWGQILDRTLSFAVTSFHEPGFAHARRVARAMMDVVEHQVIADEDGPRREGRLSSPSPSARSRTTREFGLLEMIRAGAPPPGYFDEIAPCFWSENAPPGPRSLLFLGERAGGDGVTREWLRTASAVCRAALTLARPDAAPQTMCCALLHDGRRAYGWSGKLLGRLAAVALFSNAQLTTLPLCRECLEAAFSRAATGTANARQRPLVSARDRVRAHCGAWDGAREALLEQEEACRALVERADAFWDDFVRGFATQFAYSDKSGHAMSFVARRALEVFPSIAEALCGAPAASHEEIRAQLPELLRLNRANRPELVDAVLSAICGPDDPPHRATLFLDWATGDAAECVAQNALLSRSRSRSSSSSSSSSSPSSPTRAQQQSAAVVPSAMLADVAITLQFADSASPGGPPPLPTSQTCTRTVWIGTLDADALASGFDIAFGEIQRVASNDTGDAFLFLDAMHDD